MYLNYLAHPCVLELPCMCPVNPLSIYFSWPLFISIRTCCTEYWRESAQARGQRSNSCTSPGHFHQGLPCGVFAVDQR